MTKHFNVKMGRAVPDESKDGWKRALLNSGLALLLLITITGCQTQMPQPKEAVGSMSPPFQAVTLQAGDVLQISFPGSANLDTTQQIRRDGKINLPLVGEVDAAGMTPDELQKKLIDLYAPQLVTKEVTVSVQSSTFPVYVSGCVIHPGKISSDHPITVLEAIMEAGGFDYSKANLKAVRVVRSENGHMENYTLNLQLVLDGKQNEPFYLKPSDIIYVPEKFSWF
jgi:protein involved in polysaccharide export with SLBB domain